MSYLKSATPKTSIYRHSYHDNESLIFWPKNRRNVP